MPRCNQLISFALFALLAVPLYSQGASAWNDPSPHVTRFVSVDENVRLESLIGAVLASQLFFWPEAEIRPMYLMISRQSLESTTMYMVLPGAVSARPVMHPHRTCLTASAKTCWQ